ncbi:3-oxoacyl-ACP synthase III [Pseudonocardia sp. HH130630-07]|uniref:3-oxoacyl-ACP synthase III n=1 Tax=Pseudonocardia sp. HH130630-07 TaxID=1690815 RepID=UPI000814D4D7|nr:3-oxoacyl-ACP synthase III [Pseudonocardia sp. HH130630-07]ANY08001.1 3-oxoacyl-ACP synthase [Pseudonocardia sp. HH130630-07]
MATTTTRTPGNATLRFTGTAVLATAGLDAPHVVTSAELDDRLAATYERLRLRPGMLERIAGVRERRWWPEDVSFTDAAATAGAKALAEAGVDPGAVGLLVDTSVSRARLEPSSAVSVHHALDLPTSCLNFDLGNACLGFLNAIQLAATMIDAGHVRYALVVDGECARRTQLRTIDRLRRPTATREDVFSQFATLTLGSGAAAMVLGPRERHPEGHPVLVSASRAHTEHHGLCVGDLEAMHTDAKGLLDAGAEIATAVWAESAAEFGWSDMDRYISHQVSTAHTRAMCAAVGIDPARVPLTFPTHGNMGPATIPFTLAQHSADLGRGDRVLLMGAGSGLNAACVELAW